MKQDFLSVMKYPKESRVSLLQSLVGKCGLGIPIKTPGGEEFPLAQIGRILRPALYCVVGPELKILTFCYFLTIIIV